MAIAIALLAALVAQLRTLPRAGLLVALGAALKPLGPGLTAAAPMREQFAAGRDGCSVRLVLDCAVLRRAPSHYRPLLLRYARVAVSPDVVAFPAPRSPPRA